MKGPDFLKPQGDAGLLGPGSVAWRVHANPVSLGVGAVAAVILELAEPAVRAGVWDHSNFKTDPIGRRERTLRAAMAVTYGSSELAQKTFNYVTALHHRVRGVDHTGQPYEAMDQRLLCWVHVTAHWGFLQAYLRYVNPHLPRSDQDRYYTEVHAIGRGYGVQDVPASVDQIEACLRETIPRLYVNDTVQEFLQIASAAGTSASQRWLKRRAVQAAIALLPPEFAQAVGVQAKPSWIDSPLLRTAARFANWQLHRTDGPAQQACRRVGVSTRCLD